MNKQGPTISVVIPFHRGTFFRESIGSVLAQTYPAFEIIVVNDGAMAPDVAILEQFGSDVRIIHQSNHGPAAARNLGVACASGEWIAFLDDDDLWDPKRLEVLSGFIESQPNCDALYNSYRIIGTDRISRAHNASFNDLLNIYPCPIKASSVLLRKTTLCQAGLMNCALPLCEDFECFLRVSMLTVIYSVDIPLTGRRKHSANISGQHRLKYRFRNRIITLYQDHYRTVSEKRLFAANMNCRFVEQCMARRDLPGVLEIIRLASRNDVSLVRLVATLLRRVFEDH